MQEHSAKEKVFYSDSSCVIYTQRYVIFFASSITNIIKITNGFQYEKKDVTNWLEKGGDVVGGFSWRNGPDRETTGILMWSHIFLHNQGREKIAIILLDTQGVFDNPSTAKDCEFIFALSTLLSSVQIYNISQNIQESDLQHLQIFTEYGRMSDSKPLQRLQFLIRDWGYEYKHKYGAMGGRALLNECLKVTDEQKEELKSVREHLKSCFSEIDCFLMPHPGLKVSSKACFRGQLDHIEDEFKGNLKDLVVSLLSPRKLTVKVMDGQQICAGELITYFKSYVKGLASESFIKPITIKNAAIESCHAIALSQAQNLYTNDMRKERVSLKYLSEIQFNEKEEQIRKRCLQSVSI